MTSDIDEPSGDVSNYPAPISGASRFPIVLRSVANTEDGIYQEVLNLGYNEWQKHDDWSFDTMLDWVQSRYGEEAVFITMLGKFTQQVENGGIVQWLDNGYAGARRGRFYKLGINSRMDLSLLERLRDDLANHPIGSTPAGNQVDRILTEIFDIVSDSDEECTVCQNHRYVKCEDCDGEGRLAQEEEDCDACEGSGREENGDTCQYCDGSGVVPIEEEECEYCHGEGEVPCEDCNPDGQEEMDADIVEIPFQLFEALDTQFYKISSELTREIEKYLTRLVTKNQGLLSKATALRAIENLTTLLTRIEEHGK